ncbi:MAG: hypothetical protein R3181_07895 [Rubricoccaceae bacterium]|nr:hypothetical protein [Rubricoccaceae bacterium]
MTRLSALGVALAMLALSLSGCDTGDPSDPDTTIRRVIITEIIVDDAPLLRENGDDWDGGAFGVGEEPDIFVELVNDDTGSFLFDPPVDNFSNVDANDFPLVWSSSPGPDEETLDETVFTRFNTNLAVDLYDEDPELTKGDDDFMGSTEAFNLQDLVDGDRPQFLRLESADGEIQVSLRLRYES